ERRRTQAPHARSRRVPAASRRSPQVRGRPRAGRAAGVSGAAVRPASEPRIAVVLALTVIANTCGNLLLSAGMKRVGEISNWAPGALALTLWRTFTVGAVW